MKLTDYLAEKDLSPEDFAAKINIDAVSVRRYLKGKRRPKWEVISLIVEATDGAVTANDFIPDAVKKRRNEPSRPAA